MLRQSATKVRHGSSFVRAMVAPLGPVPTFTEVVLSPNVHIPVDRTARGRAGEEVAALFLEHRGYRVLARNQRTPLGELDLVCLDGSEVVVVEVKARAGNEYGTALESIGPRKGARLRGSALWWLADRRFLPCRVRFDAVAVDLDGRGMPRTVLHLKDVLGG